MRRQRWMPSAPSFPSEIKEGRKEPIEDGMGNRPFPLLPILTTSISISSYTPPPSERTKREEKEAPSSRMGGKGKGKREASLTDHQSLAFIPPKKMGLIRVPVFLGRIPLCPSFASRASFAAAQGGQSRAKSKEQKAIV